MRTRMVLIAAMIGAVLATAASAALMSFSGSVGKQQPAVPPWVTTSYTWAQPFGWSPAPAHAQPPPSVFR